MLLLEFESEIYFDLNLPFFIAYNKNINDKLSAELIARLINDGFNPDAFVAYPTIPSKSVHFIDILKSTQKEKSLLVVFENLKIIPSKKIEGELNYRFFTFFC
ncbi:MAG: hypothetical protein MR902_01840 [Campylobacter sp.]|nr:hypothetical protein [Campylobacter sp.]